MSKTHCTVLLVDDDAALLRGLTRTLASEEFRVLAAVSAAEAGALLRRVSVDIVVCDQRMPGVTGIDFLTQLRRDYPAIKTLMLSGHVAALPVAIQAAQQIGVYTILSKPCSVAELSDAIRRAVGLPQPARHAAAELSGS
jgi:DNA-binding NtrC family response regulator